MPSDKKKSRSSKSEEAFAFDMETKENAPAEEAPAISGKGRKRPAPHISHTYSDDSDSEEIKNDEPSTGVESEMSTLLNSFGADISKTLSAKRKRLTTFTNASMKTSNRKYDEIFTTQHAEREKMQEEFGKQISSVFTQWEGDIQKSKDAEEKLEAIVRQLQKTLQQQRVVQNQRLKSLRTLQDQYMKGLNDLSKMHREQQLNINAELRKDLSNLQKKMMDDARQEEMVNVRKSLQSMLSQV
ncbi:synaptonemal complex protein 3-like [Clytia hemisphaerica]|uniref:XLR/SYCP3/FAM9 domain-containing protein n=1 Tax=Clytia hemisphaerica TaxID=252671 RepID=A0A7M5V952_9CNID|eukprot:TCONS_00004910-protein